jgi:hypothetical protein
LRNDGAGVALYVDPHVADARVTERSVALFQGAGDERVLDGVADPTHQPTARLKCWIRVSGTHTVERARASQPE